MDSIEIIDYQKEHQPYFEKLNREWIETYFWLEELDIYILQHPEKALLQNGGCILMAMYNGEVAGTVALRKINEKVFEFTKMAVSASYRRKGIAEALSTAALQKAKELGASKVFLYSNTKLQPALKLYQKVGFMEVPIEDEVYKRTDIKMEIELKN
ncbi:MAG TPA: GNAT family N-acetyltransferase [Flavisolibacter sp.]|nr:GNAT family N-acetyltransferase [Flavisolibacter sp.]